MTGQAPHFDTCQRWRAGRDVFRPAAERFQPSRARVEVLPEAEARASCARHHYSGTLSAVRISAGIFIKPPLEPEQLMGVAVFSVPMNNRVGPLHFPNQSDPEVVDLGRLVLLDHDCAGGNAETWFLARAVRMLREHRPTVTGIVSYCDPLPRYDAAGRMTKRGHCGVVYRAFNGTYRGRSSARTLLLTPRGNIVSPRALQKLRSEEVGREYVERWLQGQGAPSRLAGESAAAYVSRLRETPGFTRLRHPGNHIFTWAVHPTRAPARA